MNISCCKLCGNSSKLCKSHIIPEFFYKQIYEPGHIFYRFYSDTTRPKKAYKGINEELFCITCEQRFQKYENYVASIWSTEELNYYMKGGVSYFQNIDYQLFKLFQLSIIWRASVATVPEFENISIGNKHELIIKKRLLNNDPGNPNEYGCIIVHANQAEMQKAFNGSILIHPPYKHDGHIVYPFAFGALIWLFFVSSHLSTFKLSHLFLAQNNILPVLNSPMYAERFLLKAAKTLRCIDNSK